ncbi:CBF-domain-containing protein [Panus rudis PR-1116 ss-1]|nr:CBF-domain-containing protein [Panus rudis PR-1116 ss-1]
MVKNAPKNDTGKPSGSVKKSKKSGKKVTNEKIKEQVLNLGGDESDLALLKGVSENMDVDVGGQSNDPKLAQDVSKFLSALKGEKGPSEKQTKQKKSKSKEPKAPAAPPKAQQVAEDVPAKPKPKPEKQKGKQKATTSDDVSKADEGSKGKIPTSVTLKAGTKLIFPPTPHWYSGAAPLSPPKTPLPTPNTSQISSLTERAASLLQKDAEVYQASSASTGHSASDAHFLNTILTQGTLSDRLSALTLLVQASPVHNTKALETLRSMAERGRGKGGREEGLKAMRCVVDWWIGGGAPNRKLRYFRDQPMLLHPDAKDEHLVMWYFEDWLKKYFFHILQILETYSLDPLPYVRTQALGFIYALLRDKPEQEQNLLRLLVNKLGDTEKSVCSRASYHLLQLLQAHPNMKGVIVREIRSLIFRPLASTSAASSTHNTEKDNPKGTHIRFDDGKSAKPPAKGRDKGAAKTSTMERWNSHAWYYSAVTLNQVVLTPSEHDREVARLLIEAYFEMFREVLGSSSGNGDDDAADEEQPEAQTSDGDKQKKKQSGGKDTKKKGKEKAVRGAAGFAEVEDAHSRLISAILSGVNRALPFAKVDVGSGNEIFRKHIDTLFLITHTSTFNISLQALMLILQVITTLSTAAPSTSTSKEGEANYGTSLTDRYYRTLYASLADPRLAKSNKQAMYLNLLFKSLKADRNTERVKAFVRRFLQVLVAGIGGAGGTEFVAGGLYLLGELFSTVSGLREMLNGLKGASGKEGETYDPKKRDPQYAHASATPLYELLPLLHHYHPAISLHARQLLNGTPLTASPDLTLNTLSHFLDRFVYKNPKKPKPKGASAMQPAASSTDGASGVKLLKGEMTTGMTPVNEESWWKKRVEDVPVDEVFFYKYFTRKRQMEQERAAKAKKRKGKEDEDDDEDDLDEEESDEEKSGDEAEAEDSDKEEAEIWKAMKATMPAELQDDDLDEDSDDLASDLDDSELEGNDSDAEPSEAGTDDDEEAEGGEEKDDDEDGDDALSLAEASDAEDLLPLDADIPDGLIEYDGSDVPENENETEEWGGIGGNANKKRKRGDDEKNKRKKLRSLPTFASYEDYAKLIEDGPEDDI